MLFMRNWKYPTIPVPLRLRFPAPARRPNLLASTARGWGIQAFLEDLLHLLFYIDRCFFLTPDGLSIALEISRFADWRTARIFSTLVQHPGSS